MMAIEIALDDIKIKSKEISSEDLTKNKKSSLDDVKKSYEKSDVRKETKEEVADFEKKLSKDVNLDDTKKAKKYKEFLHWFFDSKDDIVQTEDEKWQSWVKMEVDGETFEAHVEWEQIAEQFIDYKIDKIAEEIKINETVTDELTIEKWKIITSDVTKKNENESNSAATEDFRSRTKFKANPSEWMKWVWPWIKSTLWTVKEFFTETIPSLWSTLKETVSSFSWFSLWWLLGKKVVEETKPK
jgi:hypothetical protein